MTQTEFTKLCNAGVPPSDAAKGVADAIDSAVTAIDRRIKRQQLFKEVWEAGIPTQDIADALNITRQAVSTKAARWGLAPRIACKRTQAGGQG